MNGIVVIDKPQNMTSHDVVAILRRKLKTKKIGHTGTLDPMATGVLPICIGNSTKIVDYLMDRKKTYACAMVLGSATDSQDCWGTVTHTKDASFVDEQSFKEAILSFLGDIEQMPPMFSAIKIGGEKLVDLARQGIEIERPLRKKHIFSIDKILVKGTRAEFEVTCSKGTYIRTLCHDIGLKLGTYAHMTALRRLASEPFDLSQALSLESIDLNTKLIKTDEALAFMPTIHLPFDPAIEKRLMNGVRVNLDHFKGETLQSDFYRVYLDNRFIGIAEETSNGVFIKKLMMG